MHATRLFLAISLIAAVGQPALAGWQEEISPFDRDRLSKLELSRAAGLAEVDAYADAAQRQAIHGVLDPAPRPVSAQELSGTWRCRLMKLGGIEPAIVYGWQSCRFRQTPNGLYFEKLSGTQRLSGYADPDAQGRFVLLGAMTVREERPRTYSGARVSFGAFSTPNDQVGIVTSIGAGRARIEFPYPVIESYFDVIELQR